MPPEFDREKLFRGDDKKSLSAAEEFDKRMAKLVEAAEAKLPRKMRDGVLDPNGYYAGTRRDQVEAAEHGPIIKDGLANQPFGEQLSGLTVLPTAAPVAVEPRDPEKVKLAMARMGAASKRLAELKRADPSICRSYRPGQAPPKSNALIAVEQELCGAMRQFIAAAKETV